MTTTSDGALGRRPDVAPPDLAAYQGRLLALVRRIANKDRDALIVLHELLWTKVLDGLRSTLPDPPDAQVVATATFLEVWLLARFHTTSDADVCTWIGDIMGRRVADRAPVPGDAAHHEGSRSEPAGERPRWAALAAAQDHQIADALATLLARPAGDADVAKDDSSL